MKHWIIAAVAGSVITISIITVEAQSSLNRKSRIEVLGDVQTDNETEDVVDTQKPKVDPNPPPELSCDDEGGDSKALHSSILPIKKFTEEIMEHPRELSRAQCLAVMGYAKVQDWWGVGCKERDRASVAIWMHQCLKDDWTSKTSRSFGCQLLHYKDLGEYDSSRKMETYLKNNFEDCSWSIEQIRSMTPELIDAAIRVMRDGY